jgi:hypothetical protein
MCVRTIHRAMCLLYVSLRHGRFDEASHQRPRTVCSADERIEIFHQTMNDEAHAVVVLQRPKKFNPTFANVDCRPHWRYGGPITNTSHLHFIDLISVALSFV